VCQVAADIPSIEPTEFQAGVTVQWTKALSDYPYSSGWRLTTYIVGAAKKHTVSATADTDGSGHLSTITASDSATLPHGDYWLEARVTKDAETYVVTRRQSLVITPNFASDQDVSAGFDGRTHARKCRDALHSIIEGTAGNLVINYTIFGERNVQMMTADERLKLLSYYESRVAEEEKAEAIAQGKRTGIFIRFTTPR
jgi:hypothetical protein